MKRYTGLIEVDKRSNIVTMMEATEKSLGVFFMQLPVVLDLSIFDFAPITSDQNKYLHLKKKKENLLF
jgi:hypothetical protein